MQAIEILVIGTHEEIMQTIARLINQKEEWQAKLAFSTNEALGLCLNENIKLVLIGAGISDNELISFQLELVKSRPSLPVVKHYGGGSGLLFAEIYQGLNS